jgi:hypothetical protein
MLFEMLKGYLPFRVRGNKANDMVSLDSQRACYDEWAAAIQHLQISPEGGARRLICRCATR